MSEQLKQLQSTAHTRFVFVRHGEASGVAGRCIGQFDAPLSAQAALAIRGQEWQSQNATHIISSDLSRAHSSAEIIAAQLQLPIATDTRLREMDFGEWDGRLWSELEQADGQRLAEWMDDWTHVAAPGGESLDDFVARVRAWLVDTLIAQSSDTRTILVVAHAGSIRIALCLLRAIPVSAMFDIEVPYATPMVWKPAASPQERLSV